MSTRSEDHIADEVLRRTLIEVRAARARRRTIKASLAVSAVLALLGIMIFPRQAPFSEFATPRVVEAVRPLPPGGDEAIAVMVWKDGVARLEWMNLRDLGTVELQFTLEPVFAFADEG